MLSRRPHPWQTVHVATLRDDDQVSSRRDLPHVVQLIFVPHKEPAFHALGKRPATSQKNPAADGAQVLDLLHWLVPFHRAHVHLHALLSEPLSRRAPAMFAPAPRSELTRSNERDLSECLQINLPRQAVRLFQVRCRAN